MSTEKEFVKNAVKELRGNIDLFYQQKTKEALKQFDQSLMQISEVAENLFAYRATHPEFSFEEEKIKSVLTDAMNALEERDMVLLADIIAYDFLEYIEEILDQME